MSDNNQILADIKRMVDTAKAKSASQLSEPPKTDIAANYAVFDGNLYFLKKTAKSEQTILVSNFMAEIVEVISKFDGATTEKHFNICGKMNTGYELPHILVAANQFEKGDWIIENWGPRPQITVGPRHMDHLIAGIKSKSNPSHKVIYQHTGWVKEGGKHGYITKSGKITVNGLDHSQETDLQGTMANYDLPAPEFQNPASPLEIMQDFGKLLPGQVGLILFSSVFRATLSHFARNTQSLFIQGTTGSLKSAAAGVMLSFYGKNFDGFNLTENWSSTANSIEKKASLCKDALFVVDDYLSRGTANEINQQRAKAERIFRSQGNASGRDRLTSTTAIRGAYVPAGLTMATGEDQPVTGSIQARMTIIHFAKGALDLNVLSRLQEMGAHGELAQHMSNFIHWIAMMADTNDIQQHMKLWLENQRRRYVGIGHARAPDNASSLLLGLHMFLMYAKSYTKLDESVAATIFQCAEKAMFNLSKLQAEGQRELSDADRFISLFRTAISMERGHLKSKCGSHPNSPGNFGWKYVTRGKHSEWEPQGPCLGYLHNGELLLLTASCLAVIRPLSTQMGDHFGISETSIMKALKEAGFIKRFEKGRTTIKVTCQGQRGTFICLEGDQVFDFIGNQLEINLEQEVESSD